MRTLTRAQLPLPLDHAVHIVIDLLDGLHYPHENRGIEGSPLGIVQRDISPHNVFVAYDGAVKIFDFGIAKASNREHQTKVDTLRGKVQYMSPEQCRCIEIDRRSDIFSVAYSCATR